ncbi:MAG: helicase-related protein [Tepidiformaceae bacterium]
MNAAFATELSRIDPLPHQRLAVYEQMLPQARLRFLLADDAGAGKTIMAGLYIREMLARGFIRRVLVVAPAGLIGNWASELGRLFGLSFRIITGPDARSGNPFAGRDGDLVIVSVDTLAGERMFARLQEADTGPYDLVIFDEAHKLGVDREHDLRLRKTERYRVAEALAGVPGDHPRWALEWAAKHLLLLTATPHMGKDFPYFGLWRLLEPDVLPTLDAFNAYPADARARHFLRRTKEEMVQFDGSPIYPRRISNTLSYDLSPGDVSEQRLYDETTAYIQHFYNRARILNRSAAQLAMSVFQRRLASSTWALLRSFERRVEKLQGLIDDIESGRLRAEDLAARQAELSTVRDVLDETTADEEDREDGRESHEASEDDALGGTVASSLSELWSERDRVMELAALAREVYGLEEESKLARLREVIREPDYRDEKLIVFTEHRDTLEFLVRRLEGLGFTGQVARIHGGMDYQERQREIEFFRRPANEGGATYLVATDAAGEGINLQFCWLMVNYDIPWNPARLEQRMGRIHRYGQKRDPVVIINLVAGKTREGHVLHVLLDKLERIRKELGSDKVFDVVGRLFQGVSLKEYMLQALTPEGAAEAERRIEGTLTAAQVEALAAQERTLYGAGGDVRSALARLRPALENEAYRRLLPGYVRRFVENAAPLLGLAIDGDPNGEFSVRAIIPGALDALWPILEAHPSAVRSRLTVHKPPRLDEEMVFVHPGEPIFERLRTMVTSRFAQDAERGAVFIDPGAAIPYLLHFARVNVVRGDQGAAAHAVETRLVAIKDDAEGRMDECPPEQLLLIRPAPGVTPDRALVDAGPASRDRAADFSLQRIAVPLAEARRSELASTLAERQSFVRRGFDYQEAELAATRAKLRERATAGDVRAQADLHRVRDQQHSLEERRDGALARLLDEIDGIAPGQVEFVAHALVMPSQSPNDARERDAEVERIAVSFAEQYELAAGAIEVKDVSSPAAARAAGLPERPGFDLLSIHPDGERRCIEVKGRAAIGDIEVTENEWARSANLRQDYWLYVVYDCASAHPRLVRVRDPFAALLVRAKGGVVIDESAVFAAAEGV